MAFTGRSSTKWRRQMSPRFRSLIIVVRCRPSLLFVTCAAVPAFPCTPSRSSVRPQNFAQICTTGAARSTVHDIPMEIDELGFRGEHFFVPAKNDIRLSHACIMPIENDIFRVAVVEVCIWNPPNSGVKSRLMCQHVKVHTTETVEMTKPRK
jgi:hypothetical protein